MIADMLSNKKLNLIITELLIRGRKLNISLVFITEFYFAVPKNIRLNSTHYFMMKISNKQEFKGIASNNLSDIEFKASLQMTLCKKCTEKQCSFLVIDANLASDNYLSFSKNLVERI